MSITRGSFPKSLQDGLNSIIGKNYGRYNDQHKVLFDTFSSDKAYEEDVMYRGMPGAPTKNEGAGITWLSTISESYTSRYTHETVAVGYVVTQEAVEDNKYVRDLGKGSVFLGVSMAHAKQVRAANVLNQGFAGGPTYGDGVTLLNNSHPTASGLQSNILTSPADLSEAALEDILIQISRAVDEQGLPAKLSAVSLHVHPAGQFIAHRILNSPLRTRNTGDTFAPNDINAINNMGGMPYYVNNFFTDDDAWFVKTDALDGLKCFERTPMQTFVNVDNATGNIQVHARERFSFGASDWRGIYGSPGV